ncbi:MAG: bile acid:sodium symporter family protein [Pseudomonadota bacterium]
MLIEILRDVGLPAIVAFIMFALGLGLRLAEFAAAVRRPKALIAGLVAQMLLLPAAAYGVVTLFGLTGEMALGVMILSVCPGGVTTNMFARLAGGRVALSVAMTGIVTLASALTMPAWIALWFELFLGDAAPAVSLTGLALSVFALTALPVGLGMALAHLRPAFAQRVEPGAMRLASGLFWLLILAAAAAAWETIARSIATLGPALAVLVLVLSAAGYGTARALGLDRADQITLTVETGIQNGTIGLTLVTLIYGITDATVPDAAVPIGLYSILMYGLMIPLTIWLRRRPAAPA